MPIRHKFGVNYIGCRDYESVFAVNSTHIPDDPYGNLIKNSYVTGWQNLPASTVWDSTLDRIDWMYYEMWKMGIQWNRDWAECKKYWRLESLGGAVIDPQESDGWEAVDRSVVNARKYGMKLILTIPSPYTAAYGSNLSGSPNFSVFLNNFCVPYAQFVANRYKNDSDVVIIDPSNEINGWLGQNWSNCAEYQKAIYDVIKTIAPNLRVNLVSVCTTIEEMNSLIDAMYTKGYIGKFDDYVCVHLYPPENNVVSSGYVGSGAITTAKVTDTMTKLANYGRTDVKIAVDEFGIFWDEDSSHEQVSATSLTEMYNFCNDNPNIGRVLYWRGLGRSVTGAGMEDGPGAGLIYSDTKAYTLPGIAVQNLGLEKYPMGFQTSIFLPRSFNSPFNAVDLSYFNIARKIYSDSNCTIENSALGTLTPGQENIVDKWLWNESDIPIAVQLYDSADTLGIVTYSWDRVTYADPTDWHLLIPGEKHNFKVKVDLTATSTTESFSIGIKVRG